MGGHLGLDLESFGHGGEGLDESPAHDAVAREHIGELAAEEGPEDPIEHVIAESVAPRVHLPVVLHRVASAHDHVELFGQELFHHCRRGGGVVGVVAVDEDVDVGLDVGEHAPHDVALPGAVLGAKDRARRRALDRRSRQWTRCRTRRWWIRGAQP